MSCDNQNQCQSCDNCETEAEPTQVLYDYEAVVRDLIGPVRQLMVASGQLSFDPINKGLALDTYRLYSSLVKEEYNEVKAAEKDLNPVELLDGHIDLAWVTLGKIIAFMAWHGIDTDEMLDECLMYENGPLKLTEEDFEFIVGQSRAHIVQPCVTGVPDVYRDKILLAKTITDAVLLDYPLQEAVAEVIRSNLSKITEDGVMLRNPETGKYLKPDTWSPPDLEKLLREAERIL